MYRAGRTTIAGGIACALVADAAALEYAVKLRDLARNPVSYVGERVVISDCLMISFSTILGAQCSVEPIDASVLVYVDADTLPPAAMKLADGCSTMDPARMCVLKVTGDV